jgi:hypothetical protein
LLVLQPKGAACAVGLLRWRGAAGERMTLVVKAASGGGAAQFEPNELGELETRAGRWPPAVLGGATRAPKVELCDASLELPLEVPMVCVKESPTEHIWCGDFEPRALEERDRAVVSLEASGSTRAIGERLGARAHAELSLADVPGGAETPDADEMALERMAMWDEAPAPSLSLERYATIAAEIAEEREPRGAVLERHDLSEDSWALEERAWLEKMGQEALEGDASTAVTYADLFVAAQDALGSPEEQEAMIHEYVAVTAELERADDPMPVLRRWSLSLAQWMRLDRHWSRRAATDERVREELARMLAVERARLEQEATE